MGLCSNSNNNNSVVAGLISPGDMSRIREAVCVQVEKIYDSCREKDCIENIRVMFRDLTDEQREAINNAMNVKLREVVLKDVITDIEEVPFKRGFYTVDVKYIMTVNLDFFVREENTICVVPITGGITFNKKVILFGSEGNIKIFKSHFEGDQSNRPIRTSLQQDNLPIAKIEVADPIALNAQIRGILDKFFEDNNECCCDNDESDETRQLPLRRVYVTVGIFSIIKLIRYVQLLIPAFDFCYPNKECVSSTDENPCEIFDNIEFPYNEFYPPQIFDFPGALEQEEAFLSGSSSTKCGNTANSNTQSETVCFNIND